MSDIAIDIYVIVQVPKEDQLDLILPTSVLRLREFDQRNRSCARIALCLDF